MYQVQRVSRSEFPVLRHQRYHVRRWGTPSAHAMPCLLLHGWMDVSASWQFVVDAFAQNHDIYAPDWRGFGQTRPLHAATGGSSGWGDVDHYAFVDYLGDLDFLIDHINAELGRDADAPVNLVGHSMGGNVVMMYAGIRPQRVHKLVNLEGFGMPASRPAQAPGRYAKWMDQLKTRHRGENALQSYPDAQGVARRLMRTNPRLPPDKASWLAQHWAALDAHGQWQVQGDPAHKITSAQLYRLDEVQETFKRIAAPVLAVEADTDSLTQWFSQGEHTLEQYHQRLQAVPNARVAVVANAGHMLHHDQPDTVAQLIEDFLA
jgi:pimeloyl-ACP methyl ester carboxylesterase